MIAALPFYPAVRPVLDALWAGARARLPGDVPEALTWPTDATLWDHWRRPDILLSQCCAPCWSGWLHEDAALVGAFDFGLPDTSSGRYRSVLVQRLDDPRAPEEAAGGRVAANAVDSQSGWGALRDTGWRLGPVTITGAHAASMRAVAEGAADLAAIDAVTWRLNPHPRLRVRRVTPPTPAPPLFTRVPAMAEPLRAALDAAARALPVPMRRRAGLVGVVPAERATWGACPVPAPPERAA